MKKGWFLVVFMLMAALLLASCGVSQDVYDDVRAERDAAKAKVASLQKDISKANSDLATAKTDLAEIKKVYPPRDFSSKKELQDWLFKNDVSDRPITTGVENWYGYALDIQEDALKDGYVVSVDYDVDEEGSYWVYCIAIINGDIWFWDPEIDELEQEFNIGKVK